MSPVDMALRQCVQILADVSVILHEAHEGSVVESAGLSANETCLVQYFSAMETSSAARDDVSVWEHVGLITASFRRRGKLCVVTKSNVALFLNETIKDDSTNNRPHFLSSCKRAVCFQMMKATSQRLHRTQSPYTSARVLPTAGPRSTGPATT